MKTNSQKRWAKFAGSSAILASLLASLFIEPVSAVSTTPEPICVGSTCTVTFDYSGDYFVWTPPTGAKNLTFDLAGAQGASAAAFGGRVTGSITSTPASLYIFVGGAGTRGSGAIGGFNGGGNAGAGGVDAGSGGGATDIRTSIALADRIAVAGGGGGQAGVTGGAGGAAGGATGSSGVGGQGGAGTGGSATAGGSAGFAGVGASAATVGTSGKGGNGGSSAYSGGGGGGGGYFGGGGGGADADTCCSNGGGGGGGSSWVNSTLISSATNTASFRTGAGRAVLTYQMPPEVLKLQAANQLSNAAVLSFALSFSESVTGLAAADLTTTGSATNCEISVTGSGANYTIALSGCSSGSVALSLAANSVQGAQVGPVQAFTSEPALLDYESPAVEVGSPATPHGVGDLRFSFGFDEAVTGLTSTDFETMGQECQISSVTQEQNNYLVSVSNCLDSTTVQISLRENSVTDSAGNLGPLVAANSEGVFLDLRSATATWASLQEETFGTASYQLVFDEPITGLTAEDFSSVGTAVGCRLAVTQAIDSQVYGVEVTDCQVGEISIELLAFAVTDSQGNLGPASPLASPQVLRLDPPISPEPAPIVAPQPAPAETLPAIPPASPVAEPSAEPNQPVASPVEPKAPGAYEQPDISSDGPNQGDDSSVLGVDHTENSQGPGSSAETGSMPTEPETATWPSLEQIQTWMISAVAAAVAGFGSVGLVKAVSTLRRRRVVRLFGV